MRTRLCSRCRLRAPWSPHGRCTLCIECVPPYEREKCLRMRRQTERAITSRARSHIRRARSGDHAEQFAGMPLCLLEYRGEAMTRAEVAARLGVTEQRIGQIETAALNKLRVALAGTQFDLRMSVCPYSVLTDCRSLV